MARSISSLEPRPAPSMIAGSDATSAFIPACIGGPDRGDLAVELRSASGSPIASRTVRRLSAAVGWRPFDRRLDLADRHVQQRLRQRDHRVGQLVGHRRVGQLGRDLAGIGSAAGAAASRRSEKRSGNASSRAAHDQISRESP